MSTNYQIPALPQTAREFSGWTQVQPFVEHLLATTLTEDTVDGWLARWTQLAALITDVHSRRRLAAQQDTKDADAQERYHRYLEEIDPHWRSAEQKLIQKLLQSGLQPDGLEMPLRQMQADAELFRDENLPLMTREKKLAQEYSRISGAQTVTWEGAEITLEQLQPVLRNPQRAVREEAWRLSSARQLADRGALDVLWAQLVTLRTQIAENAGYPDYRAFRWRELHRFDYTPDDCLTFHAAIEEVAVPALERVYARRRRQLGLETLRPWDLDVDPAGRPPLRPFASISELEAKTANILARVGPQMGRYYARMRDSQLLDLDNRKGKAPGGFCTGFPLTREPFIFMNAIGLPRDVDVLLHEMGHAAHNFGAYRLPYYQQWYTGAEFAEVASMAMELLSAPYLTQEAGGFYTPAEAARARREQLELILFYWPYIAVVDAFQHWAYTHADEAVHGEACDAQWSQLWRRFMRGVDWEGLEPEMATGWQRKLHIFRYPFYYVEYGLAQLGAVQVWRNALADRHASMTHFLQALALGNTAPMPQLYATAGVRFAFDAATVREAVTLIEETLHELETSAE